ncbi:oxalate:formate antiporter [Pseudomethylobacillus aquaticus]|uniref:Oxalate:formate antiporter n=1 Tax=Pseudomethylobacillus aquaticus TaxID=2676064 RepID=A0A3N0V6L7_9PROT|nr:oxalate:formate antiporter [Pseudomethylobacillus aquaticus]ROH88325.1 oxalate:formate antiporter [Pseudomethylobacillus aquaticus]
METKSASLGRYVVAILFWAYVLIPLAWGVSQTLRKALLLLH